MSEVIPDNEAMVEFMKAQSAHFGAELKTERLPDGRFRLTMSDEDREKLRRLTDHEE